MQKQRLGRRLGSAAEPREGAKGRWRVTEQGGQGCGMLGSGGSVTREDCQRG